VRDARDAPARDLPRMRATIISVRDSSREEFFARTAQRKPEFASAKITYFSFSPRARTFPPQRCELSISFQFSCSGDELKNNSRARRRMGRSSELNREKE
jgi:hypothetical protein